jgi:hypothetical protein
MGKIILSLVIVISITITGLNLVIFFRLLLKAIDFGSLSPIPDETIVFLLVNKLTDLNKNHLLYIMVANPSLEVIL